MVFVLWTHTFFFLMLFTSAVPSNTLQVVYREIISLIFFVRVSWLNNQKDNSPLCIDRRVLSPDWELTLSNHTTFHFPFINKCNRFSSSLM